MTIPGDAGNTLETFRKGASGSFLTVVGIYVDSDTARIGIEQLHAQGFTGDEISLVVRDSEAAAEIPSQAAAEKAGNSTGAGVALGGVGGGILAGLIGAGLLAIPGAGPFLAAGWIASAVGGAAVGAAAGGWIATTAALGVPEDIAEEYGRRIEQGDFLVMVLANEGEDEERARRTMSASGARDVASYPYQARPKEFPGTGGTLNEEANPD
ncbi:MAG TPA: hypothetical protein VNE17_07365 [Nitrolancea sp.]|nr:hypothetical protein [Nitrolancea sp.]